jgi:hypothetical protein
MRAYTGSGVRVPESGRKGDGTYQVFIPPSMESRLVCGLKTDIPLAASFRREDCSGLASVMDFKPEKIWKGTECCSDDEDGSLRAGGTRQSGSSRGLRALRCRRRL